jgi:phosphoglucosamine mutase
MSITTDRIEFGTDGIRGVAGLFPLDPLTLLKIGRALGELARQQPTPQVIIGRDTRVSGDMISAALIAGLTGSGVTVTEVGIMSTPGLAYLTRVRGMTLGIMVSASHNPYEQNGIKVFGGDGYKLSDSDEETLEGIIADYDVSQPTVDLAPAHLDHNAAAQYIQFLSESFSEQPLRDFEVVLDCSNGAASFIAPAAFRELGAQVTALKANPTGTNINLNCGSEFVRRNRSALLSAIKGSDADLGIAFDGDADRVVLVTPDGMLIDGDHLLGILGVQLKRLGKLPGDTVVATDMSNSGLEHFLDAHGIHLLRTKVGDRYVMEAMQKGGFALGGEQAGHLITRDHPNRTSGDGIYVGILAAVLAAHSQREGKPLAELAREIPRYPQVIASAHLNSKADLKLVPGLAELTEQTLAAFGGKGRVNLRFSGTEPNLLRAMVEGGPENDLKEVVLRALRLCGVVASVTGTANPKIDVVDCVTGAPVEV